MGLIISMVSLMLSALWRLLIRLEYAATQVTLCRCCFVKQFGRKGKYLMANILIVLKSLPLFFIRSLVESGSPLKSFWCCWFWSHRSHYQTVVGLHEWYAFTEQFVNNFEEETSGEPEFIVEWNHQTETSCWFGASHRTRKIPNTITLVTCAWLPSQSMFSHLF